ncbi:N-acetylglucosamine-6-phosphate deacetylase [Candidatus Bathyarchaeota archaeon]|nr:MAG: N-acetylglucosamine-6-phosphate deacetylase [Candidatus Bathyarchaeota archaeon]
MEKISVIKNGTVITPSKMIKNGVVVFKDERIITVGQEKDVETPKEAKVIDASGGIVAPGFIDIHIHGGKGTDVMDASYKAINKLARFKASHGTTAFLATTISAAHNDLLNAAKTVKVSIKKGTDGAEVLGIHLEGPYINPKKCGGQDSKYIRPPSTDEFREILKASNYAVRLVTLAPEVEGAKKLIVELRNFGITASIGHSNATYSEVVDAIKHGISHAAHTFNRMRGFDHREPGVVGTVLIHDELTAELICDYVHVHPAAMKLLTKVKGSSGVVLVTDAIRAAGMPDGKYKLGKRNVIVKNGVSRLESGGLAGSTLTMNKAVRNMVNLVGASLQEAVSMATINPAKVVGVDNRKGSLEQGKDADFVILDRELNVCSTIVRGKMVHRKTMND